MKTIAVIPTKNRKTVNDVIYRIAPMVNWVVVISENSMFEDGLPHNVIIEEGEYSLCDARNLGTEYARAYETQIMFQIDDDVNFSSETITTILQIMKDEPRLAAVGSDAQLLAFWNKDLKTNKPYKLSGVASQLWAVRMSAVEEVLDNFDEEAFEYETMEDIRFNMKLWSLGLPVVRLHGDESLYHKPVIARLSKTDAQGGQTISVRDHWLPIAIEHMQEFVGKDQVMRFCKLGSKPDGQLCYRLGYNYPVMIANSIARNGKIGYIDTKEHKL